MSIDMKFSEKFSTNDTMEIQRLKFKIRTLEKQNIKLKKINHNIVKVARDERKIMFKQYEDIKAYAYSGKLETSVHHSDPWTYELRMKFDSWYIPNKFEINKLSRRYIRTKVLPGIEKQLIKIFGI